MTLVIDRPSVDASSEAVATGRGCPPNHEVVLRIDGNTVGTGSSDAQGAFEVGIEVPRNLEEGRYDLEALCGATVTIPIDIVKQTQNGGPPLVALGGLGVFIFFLLETQRFLDRQHYARRGAFQDLDI